MPKSLLIEAKTGNDGRSISLVYEVDLKALNTGVIVNNLKRLVFAVLAAFAMSVCALAQTDEEKNQIAQAILDAITIYRDGDANGAIAALEKLEAKAPNNADRLSWLGFLYLQTEQYSQAVKALVKAREAKPDDLEIVNNLGNAYLKSGNATEALRCYKIMSDARPEMFEPWYNSGTIYLDQKDYANAISMYGKALTLKPDDAFSHNNMGIALEATGDVSKAAKEYMTAASLRPDYVLFSRNSGFALFRSKQYAEALPYLLRAQQAAPNDADLKLILAENYVLLRKSPEARQIMEDLKANNDDNYKFWFNLGVLRSMGGDKEEAISAYRRALEISPNDPDTLNNLGLLTFESGNYEEAAKIFERQVGLVENSTQAKLNLAAALARLHQLGRAVSIWKDFVKANPSRDDVRVNLANALWLEGDKENAKYHFGQVLMHSPNNASALNGMGLWYYEKDKLAEAEAKFRAAIASDAKLAQAYNNLALTLERRNKKAEAIKYLEQAVKIEPDNQEARGNLERMKSNR